MSDVSGTLPRMSRHVLVQWLVVGLVVGLVTACGSSGSPPPATAPQGGGALAAAPSSDGSSSAVRVDHAALVAAVDRSEADRALDAGRRPVATLAFFDARPGMRVAEIASGTGYTAELLARAVAPGGEVYAVNNRFVLERFAEKPWSARLQTPAMANVTRIDREFDDPLPPEVQGLDLVVNVLFYHDTVWMETDRAAMNAAVFRALRPGGRYVVIDHAAAEGHGTGDAKTLHRIEPAVVRAEVEAAGFRFVEAGDFLANPDDGHDWNASPGAAGERRGTSDRFAFAFEKP